MSSHCSRPEHAPERRAPAAPLSYGGSVSDPLDELALAPPAQFVATRSRIVADLKAAGEQDEAKRVGKLRRPTQVQWALNVAVREHADLAAGWLSAVASAQSAGTGDLRTALAAVRAATGALAKAAGTRTAIGGVAQLLTEAASDPELAARVSEGTLGLGVDSAPSPLPVAAQPKRAPRSDAALKRALASVELARSALDVARSERQRADEAVAAAAAELDDARERARAAEQAHIAAERRRAAAERLMVDAQTDLERATAKVERLGSDGPSEPAS